MGRKKKWNMFDTANPTTVIVAAAKGRKNKFESPAKTTQKTIGTIGQMFGLDSLMNLLLIGIGLAVAVFLIYIFLT